MVMCAAVVEKSCSGSWVTGVTKAQNTRETRDRQL